ncbi:MAG: putative DNA binding domain-containing protein [Anaerolineae bacterium]
MRDSETFVSAVLGALAKAEGYTPRDQVPPVTVLWPDEAREWELLLPHLREQRPILSLGAYDAALTGPACWLRCVVDRTLTLAPADDRAPVIYLPGISAQALRDVAHANRELALLAELQFRGATWVQRDGRDWTPTAFLRSRDAGMGVDVLTDDPTRAALRRSLPALADVTIARLSAGAPWKAADFDALLGFPRHEPSIEELLAEEESDTLEFKSTARVDYPEGKKNKEREKDIRKAVAALLNSKHGGTLLIGVTDDKFICGLDMDYRTLRANDQDRDGFERWLMNMLLENFGWEFVSYIRATFPVVNAREICRVTVLPGPKPLFIKEPRKGGKGPDSQRFYVRTGNQSVDLSVREEHHLDAYVKDRWPQLQE